jgi:hypothetical protein
MEIKEPELQRDMDLIRLKLLQVAGYNVDDELSRFSGKQQAFHSALLIDAGYIFGQVVRDQHGFPANAVMIHLTWEGFEFLELMKDKTVWKSARSVFTKAAGWSTPILIEWLKMEAKKHLPIP